MRSESDFFRGNALLVANYASDVGYAWWLMENFWIEISRIMHAHGQKSFLIYPEIRAIPDTIQTAPIQTVELRFSDSEPAQEKALLDFVKDNHIKFVYLSDRPYRSQLYRKLRASGVDIIVNHDHSPGCPTLLSKLLRVPRNFMFRRAKDLCDAYIAVSHFVHEKMVNFAGLPPELCSTVQNGIEPIDRQAPRTNYREAFSIPRDAFVVATVGRASVYKGIDFIIECAHELIANAQLSDLYFVYCGDGPDLEQFRALVAEKSLESRFLCLGRRSDVRDILVHCNAAVHASPLEACSLSILEYMSAGLATVAPPVGGNTEQIIDHETGLFYRYRDKQDLIDKLRFLYENADVAERIGEKAAAAVSTQFSLNVMNLNFAAQILQILGCRPQMVSAGVAS